MQTVDILQNHGYGYRLVHSCSLDHVYLYTPYIFFEVMDLYICTSNGPEVVDLVMDRMCGDESRHAVRTLYSDLIDDNEIRHPNHYCWSILLSLLNVMAIMEFSSPLISWQHHMCPLLLSPALHQYMKALCFVREAEQMGRTSLHCVCKAMTEEYNGSFIVLWKHGTACSSSYIYHMSVNRVRTKYNRAEHLYYLGSPCGKL